MSALDYVLARLREPSTWVGLGSFLTGVGIAIAPDLWEQITAVGLSVGGFLAIFLKEGQS